jgi:hypothetical protein
VINPGVSRGQQFERGLHYNIISPEGILLGFLINLKFYDASTWLPAGVLDPDGRFLTNGECTGQLAGLSIIGKNGSVQRLLLVPF